MTPTQSPVRQATDEPTAGNSLYYYNLWRAQATEIATLRATHARQADTIDRLTREHAEVVARLEVMRAEVVVGLHQGDNNEASDVIRSHTDGNPYYCTECGAGYGEYMACESVDCRLETREKAIKRRAPTHATQTGGGENG